MAVIDGVEKFSRSKLRAEIHNRQVWVDMYNIGRVKASARVYQFIKREVRALEVEVKRRYGV